MIQRRRIQRYGDTEETEADSTMFVAQTLSITVHAPGTGEVVRVPV